MDCDEAGLDGARAGAVPRLERQMVRDAEDRGLVSNDVTTSDDSPAWIAKRQVWTE